MITEMELRGISLRRLFEAETLYGDKAFAAAMYLGGYSVECALKAIIARQTIAGQFYDKEIAKSCFTHDFYDLVKLSGLRPALDAHMTVDIVFRRNWDEVRQWRPEWRYEVTREPREARKFLDALGDQKT